MKRAAGNGNAGCSVNVVHATVGIPGNGNVHGSKHSTDGQSHLEFRD